MKLAKMRSLTRRVRGGTILVIVSGTDHRLVAAAKHAEFIRARGQHYGGEAEAMKVRPSAPDFRNRSDMSSARESDDGGIR
jgi:hypothetical protein